MKESIKLLGSDFVFNIESMARFIQEQSNDFLVVAFVGPQNSGKSTLANLLLNADPEVNEKIFKTRSRQCLTHIGPITKGIDIYISKERVIVLDCAPILSNISYKDFISSELDDLKTLSFLLTVCNIIVIVQEKYVNSSIARIILAAEMMRTRNPLNGTDEENLAQIMLVENKAQNERLAAKHMRDMKSMYKTIFQCSKINYFLMDSSKPDEKNTTENVNFFVFPDLKHTNQSTVKNSINNFRTRILMNKRYTTKYHQGTQFNEKMWLQSLIKTWESQCNNYFFKKYGNLKEKFNLLNHVSINDGLKYDKHVYYPDD
ncbi:nonsense-mediated mRNA decay factor SMG9-like [Culicoides brevitarsis]|uniref:nonsense-mediated mRNA decay factor SMG9-like n=1 Tax=Culicoides brevitarsis TaxID=469753 RepID=UPI00307BA565